MSLLTEHVETCETHGELSPDISYSRLLQQCIDVVIRISIINSKAPIDVADSPLLVTGKAFQSENNTF